MTVAVAELASAAREGLLAVAIGTGLQVLQAMLEEDVARALDAVDGHHRYRHHVGVGQDLGGLIGLEPHRPHYRGERVAGDEPADVVPVRYQEQPR